MLVFIEAASNFETWNKCINT